MNLLYTRVSTEEQAKGGYSLEYQKNRLIEYCTNNGIDNYRLIADDGYSGKNDKRKGYQKVLKKIKSGDVEKLIFLKIDRLSRNIEDYQKLVNLCLEYKVEMISLSEQISTTAMGKFAQNLFIAMTQMEREQISERTKNGYVGKLEQGKYPFGVKLPLGISKDEESKLYYNDDIAKVRYIFDLFERGYSCKQIRLKYMEEYDLYVNKNYIEQLVKKELYKGYITYNGIRYDFLEPVYKKPVNQTTERIRNLTKHDYILKKYLEDYTCETQIQESRNGRVRTYKYYRHKHDKKICIEESKFLKKVDKVIDLEKQTARTIKDDRLKRLNQMYVFNEINAVQYNQLKREIKERYESLYKLELIKSIDISEDRFIKLDIGKEVLKFKY